jgi:hypothetical protein
MLAGLPKVRLIESSQRWAPVTPPGVFLLKARNVGSTRKVKGKICRAVLPIHVHPSTHPDHVVDRPEVHMMPVVDRLDQEIGDEADD